MGGLLETYYNIVVVREEPQEGLGKRGMQDGYRYRVKYFPTVDVDDFWANNRYFSPLTADRFNDSIHELSLALTISLDSLPLVQYQGWMYLEQVFRMMADLGFQDRDVDDVKDLLSGSSLRVLALTYVVVGLHVLFDFLAFKEDIGFFMGREDYSGMYPPPHMTCMYPPPHMTCMYPPPHMT
jgi:hypothetical protein